MIQSSQIHICDVCRLLDFDVSKKLCSYCGLCDAFICEKDSSNWGRRLLAAAKRKLEGGYRGVNNYEEMLKGEHNDTPTNTGTNA